MNFAEDDLAEEVPDVAAEAFPRLRPVHQLSRFGIEGAVIALRMIQGQRWHSRLVRRGDICDEDILTLVGLELDDRSRSKLTSARVRAAFAAQLTRLELRARKCPDALDHNIAKLGELLRLSATERAVLRVAVITSQVKYFPDLFQNTVLAPVDLLGGLRNATGISRRNIDAALAQSGSLRRSGFFENADLQCSLRGNPLELQGTLVNALLAPRFDETRFLRGLIRPAQPPTLRFDDFNHMPDLDVVRRYLGSAAARGRRGVNVLFHGAPGTGKTQFASTLAASLGVALHDVPNENAEGEAISGVRRFNAYTVCQNLLARRPRQMLLFDEVEDVFGSGGMAGAMFAMFGVRRGRNPDDLRKSWVNETLERNPVPAIWICNSIDAIDPAYLRRFDMVVEFRAPATAVRRRMIDRYFPDGAISAACATRLASIAALPPAQIERAARVARTLRTRDATRRDAEVERLITTSLRAMGLTSTLASPALPTYYDPTFINADCDLGGLVNGLGRKAEGRLCLYGPPGTGKTAFAHHVGRAIDRPVIVKRGSDLLDKYVGGTEAHIAAAFRQAKDDEAILVIDEADGFLRDREGAQRSWEVTQVNELLTQMEAFEGIFIASTNLMEALDAASLRRFDFKIRFGYLTRPQRRALLQSLATDVDNAAIQCIDHVEYATPGDFANALRQLRVTGADCSAMAVARLVAGEVALKAVSRCRPIGFAA